MNFAGASRTSTAIGIAYASAPVSSTVLLFCTVVAGGTPIAGAMLTREILDGVSGPASRANLAALGGLLAGIGLLAVVVPQARRFAHAEMQRAVNLEANGRLFAAVNRMVGLARFEDPAFRDRLQIAHHAGAAAPVQLLSTALNVAQSILTMSGFIVTLATIGPWMAVAVTMAAIPTLKAELAISVRRAGIAWDLSPAVRRQAFYARLLADVQAAKEVRLFGLGAFFRDRMLRETRNMQAANHLMDRREFLIQARLGLYGAVVTGAGLIWAIAAAQRGRLTVGDVSLFVAALAGIQLAVGSVVRELAQSHQNLLMFDHYHRIISAEPDLPMPAEAVSVGPLRGSIELRDVWFRYSDDLPWVLTGVSLTLRHGSSLALVGPNGSGKSTIVKLVCRMYDPVKGGVFWDGVDIRELRVEELRRRIGAVFQDFMAYDMTAEENIAVGDLDAATQHPIRIRTVARTAQIDEAILGLPQGYDTMLTRTFLGQSENGDPTTGVFLSGGQWRRIALARALMRSHADLLIMDEPSSGLDALAEHEIHRRLRSHRSGRTSLLISHRLNTVRDADTIAVLGDGRVTEQGTHEELLRADGQYTRLFLLQAEGYGHDRGAGPPPS